MPKPYGFHSIMYILPYLKLHVLTSQKFVKHLVRKILQPIFAYLILSSNIIKNVYMALYFYYFNI